ncbi:phenylacetate--CoA ligase family protein [Candidatus Kaiserbacteria bacterium]|nr:phenylacetate--CoA ligase family protein [Candidatus Kaiserbacteria bacterium]
MLFHRAAQRIPAYKDFLKKHKVRAQDIETAADFAQVPPTTKENYIAAYSLKDRSWDGDLSDHCMLAMSSGTSGSPTLWPRGASQEREATRIHEFLFTELFEIDRYRTLLIIGFPMGIYVSGIATAFPSFNVSLDHPRLTIATVGNNKDAILSLVKTVGAQYQQIVLVGHPFFLKDILETGIKQGIDWKKSRTRMLSCSEGFNETWRAYVAQIAGGSADASFFNTYGSSEFLLVGYENPYTIRIRQEAEKNPALNARLFGSTVTPNLFQYNPQLRYIETDGHDLLITAKSGIPLIRFNQHDAGRVLSYAEVHSACPAHKGARFPWKLPFVTLTGRSDRTLVFYAANVYPEHISIALEAKEFVPKLTGKFLMRKQYTKDMDQYLEILIELCDHRKADPALAASIQKAIVNTLEKVNMEYLFLRNNLQKDLVPRIVLRPYQDPTYFKPGLKPRFIA